MLLCLCSHKYLRKEIVIFLYGSILTEPDFPYDKKPNKPSEIIGPNPSPLPVESPEQPSRLPICNGRPREFTCPKCKKVFTTQEELTFHLGTVHQSPKKKV